MFVAYPGLDPDDRTALPGPDPNYVPPAGIEVLLMVEWVQARSGRRQTTWDDAGKPLEAWDQAGEACDPLELTGSDVRSAILSTYQLAR